MKRLLLAVPGLLYLALPTRNYYWDGVAFAIAIEKHPPPASLLHPNHLIYGLWGAWLYGLFESRALFLMQRANCILAALCVPLLYWCLRRRGVAEGLALPAALVFGFSATWWKFATDADAYVPAICLLLCCYLLLERPKTAGLVHAGAMLFHELSILFLPVALARMRKGRRVYLACALVPVAAAYWVSHRDVHGLLAWMTSHSPDSGFSFNPVVNLWLSCRGTLRLLIGGRLSDAAMALGCAAAIPYGKLQRPPRHLWIWLGVYAVFLFFWMPQNTFYRLFYLPPLVLLAAASLRDGRNTRLAVWGAAAILLVWNFVFAIYPQSRAELNTPLRFAQEARSRWPEGTPILFYRFHPDLWVISYFNQQASWVSFEQADAKRLEQLLRYAHGQKTPLWLEETAYLFAMSDPGCRGWLEEHVGNSGLLEYKDSKHDFRFHWLR